MLSSKIYLAEGSRGRYRSLPTPQLGKEGSTKGGADLEANYPTRVTKQSKDGVDDPTRVVRV